jgi:phospholipase C
LPNPTPKKNTRPKQEAGKRPARALPYQPNASVSELKFMADDRIQILITMTNEGPQATRASHFAVYANAFRAGGPWQYTVPAYDAKTDRNGSVTDFFNVGKSYGEGAYDLSVVGPNRFLRRIVGHARAPGKDLEVTSSYSVDPATGQTAIAFALRNDTSRAAVFVIEANAYRSGGAVSTFSVPAGSVGHASFDQTSVHGWYDLTVSSNLDAGWSRRFAGHMEDGAASVSG